MNKFVAIFVYLMSLAAIMSGVTEASPQNCRSSVKSLNRKVGNGKRGVSFPLMHLYSECSPFRPPNRTWESLMSEKIKADVNRLRFLKRSMSNSRSSNIDQEDDANVPVKPGSGEYIINVGFGTPEQSMYTLIDTGSNVAWIPCTQCQGCDTTAAPPFDSTLSSSYKVLDCNSPSCSGCGENSECEFEVIYGDHSQVKGVLSSDAITLGSQSLSNFAFGCAESVSGLDQNQPGLMGLGGGSLSLLNQPTAELFGGTFSYCLPSLQASSASSGSLVLGKEAALSTPGLQFTTLIKDDSKTTFYFVNLNGISVGDTTVPVPATSIASGGGTFIDSGTTITRLVDVAYTAVRDAFRSQMPNMQVESTQFFDTCYDLSSSSVDLPTITLHLDGNVELVLPKENILFSQGSRRSCLAFVSSLDSRSIIGSVQQQNLRVVFDVPNSRVGFAQESCTSA